MQPLRSLPGLRVWRSMTQLQRVMVYFRWSMYVVVGCMFGIVFWLGNRVGQSPIALLVMAIQTAAVWVICAQFLREAPARRTIYRPALGVLAAGVVIMAVWASLLAVPDLARLYWMAQLWFVGAGVAMFWPTSAVVAAAVVGWLVTRDPLVLVLVAIDFTMRSTYWVVRTLVGLDEARRTSAALSVAEERLRFSRDVHDVVGRSLSAIAVKSELAARLSEKGDPRAGDQMRQVRQLAHDALAEARELARGYRTANYADELDGARSLVEHAGIDCVVTGPGVDDRWAEPAAWVIREAVTNVIRHSAARWVEITVDPDRIRVANDGVRPDKRAESASASGSGLAQLRSRIAQIGGTLEVTQTPEIFTVTAVFADAAVGEEKP